MKPRQFDLIVFDWDGTLSDSTGLIVLCMQSACADIGVPVPSKEKAAYVIGLGLQDALAHAVPDLPRERYRELALRYRHHYMARANELVLFDGVLAMLQDLKTRNHWLAVATGKNRAGLNDALAHSGMGPLFDATRTADETQSKPHPQMLLELMREFGTAPERTLMIGDTTHDLQLAANAGTASIGVSYGAHDVAAFADYKTHFVAHSATELHEWLSAHG